MCSFLFKNKLKLKDTESLMFSLINKNVKLNTNISVAQNYVALVYYKERFLMQLESGDYSLNKKTFQKVFEKNERKNEHSKKQLFDFNIHYVSICPHNISLTIKQKHNFNKKINYTIKANFIISNPQIFAKEILLTWYKTTSERTLNYVHNWFKEFASYFFKKQIKNKVSFEQHLFSIANKYFKRYGISINKIDIHSEQSQSDFFKINNDDSNLNNPVSIDLNANEKYCKKCQARLIEGAEFCTFCGTKCK